MHFGDSIFIFLLALVLFGPKRLPEIGRQVGKLLAEFRRASNDFKLQIDEELRTMEQQERQKKLEQEQAAAKAKEQEQLPAPAAETPASAESGTEASDVKAEEVKTEAETPSTPVIQPPSTGETVSSTAWPYNKDLPVAEIDPAYKAAEAKEAQANGHTVTSSESEQAPIHHG